MSPGFFVFIKGDYQNHGSVKADFDILCKN